MCGLFGLVGKHSRSFDYSTFCTLGIANDSRGGDSCGIFIDGYTEYGVDKNKYFSNFFYHNKFLGTLDFCTIALGHCRKASIGSVNESSAQPIVIKSKSGDVEFVVLHNGTIFNYKNLANKYIPNIDINGLTDSQVMALIFYHKGYEVLSEYIGGAVFVVVDYRKSEILLFKGASKKDTYSKEESEERPLFYNIDDGELVFSSIGTYLVALRPYTSTNNLKPNCIYQFNGVELVEYKKISRKNCKQKQDSIFTSQYNMENYTTVYNTLSDFINTNIYTNVYLSNNKKMHGRIITTVYGRIITDCSKVTGKEVYFWNGVALKNKFYFKLLSILKNKSNLSFKEFDSKFMNLIRYLSIDGIYKIDDIWYRATSPISKELYTGKLQMLTSAIALNIVNGIVDGSSYGNSYNNPFEFIDKNLNFKDYKEECKFLMKSIKNGQI